MGQVGLQHTRCVDTIKLTNSNSLRATPRSSDFGKRRVVLTT